VHFWRKDEIELLRYEELMRVKRIKKKRGKRIEKRDKRNRNGSHNFQSP